MGLKIVAVGRDEKLLAAKKLLAGKNPSLEKTPRWRNLPTLEKPLAPNKLIAEFLFDHRSGPRPNWTVCGELPYGFFRNEHKLSSVKMSSTFGPPRHPYQSSYINMCVEYLGC